MGIRCDKLKGWFNNNSYLLLSIFFMIFFFWIASLFLLANGSISSYLMTKGQEGEGFANLIAPFIAICYGLGIFFATIIYEILSNKKFDSQLTEINTKITEIERKMAEIDVQLTEINKYCLQMLKKIDPTGVPISLNADAFFEIENTRCERITPARTDNQRSAHRFRIYGAILSIIGVGAVLIEIITFYVSGISFLMMFASYYQSLAPGISLVGVGIAVYALGVTMSPN